MDFHVLIYLHNTWLYTIQRSSTIHYSISISNPDSKLGTAVIYILQLLGFEPGGSRLYLQLLFLFLNVWQHGKVIDNIWEGGTHIGKCLLWDLWREALLVMEIIFSDHFSYWLNDDSGMTQSFNACNLVISRLLFSYWSVELAMLELGSECQQLHYWNKNPTSKYGVHLSIPPYTYTNTTHMETVDCKAKHINHCLDFIDAMLDLLTGWELK